MTAPPLRTDADVRTWAAPWCAAWCTPLFGDLAAKRAPSLRQDQLVATACHALHALTVAWDMPYTSATYRGLLTCELHKLHKLLVARRPLNSRAIDCQVWQVAYRWCDLATTGAMSPEWIETDAPPSLPESFND